MENCPSSFAFYQIMNIYTLNYIRLFWQEFIKSQSRWKLPVVERSNKISLNGVCCLLQVIVTRSILVDCMLVFPHHGYKFFLRLLNALYYKDSWTALSIHDAFNPTTFSHLKHWRQVDKIGLYYRISSFTLSRGCK